MVLIFGAGIMTMVWCLLTIWVARTAQGLGRSAFWGLGAGVVGVLGVITGIMLAGRVTEGIELSAGAALVAMLVPPTTMILSMVAVGYVLKREPIHVSKHGSWPVAFMGQGPGSIEIDRSCVRITWKDTVREVSPGEALRAEADGECVRITLGAEELVAMPMGKPATPAGRKHQSLLLAKRLRMRAG